MTYASPELPTATESVEQTGLPAASRRLKPASESGEESRQAFERQFARSRKLLSFLARRILNCVQEAEEAVKNCRLNASRNPPRFSSEGAFKSWLVRILIDEAALLRTKQSDSTPTFETKSGAK